MRICHIITRLIVGGAQENTILTCRGLVARGHEVTLVSGPETGPEGSLHAEARATGARTVIHPHLVRAVSPASDLMELLALRRLIRAKRPHVVHTHSSKAGILGRLAAWIEGVPVVIHTNHGLPFHDLQGAAGRTFYRMLEQVASRITGHIVCVGEDMRRASRRAHLGPPSLFSVIRSGMEVAAYVAAPGAAQARRELAIPEGALVIGTVGRFSAQKGPRHFLDAAQALAVRRQDATFLWVGDGPQLPEMKDLAAARGLPIRFTGLVPPARIPLCLAAMDVVLMTSLWEGLPRVAVQALLCGRPVAAFDSDGVREVVRHGATGMVAPRGDVEALVTGVLEIVGRLDAFRREVVNARPRLVDEFRGEAMVAKLEQLYRVRLQNGV